MHGGRMECIKSVRKNKGRTRCTLYCPIRGMGEKPSPLGEDFSLILKIEIKLEIPQLKLGVFTQFHT